MPNSASAGSGYKPPRRPNGQLLPGYSGNPGGGAGVARRKLNLATIEALQEAFSRGGKKAIDKVMRQSPAMFLKMLVLLVPRELEVTHSNAIKQMTDEQIEAAIEAIKAMLAGRARGSDAKVIDAQAAPLALPSPKRRRKRRTVTPSVTPKADDEPKPLEGLAD